MNELITGVVLETLCAILAASYCVAECAIQEAKMPARREGGPARSRKAQARAAATARATSAIRSSASPSRPTGAEALADAERARSSGVRR